MCWQGADALSEDLGAQEWPVGQNSVTAEAAGGAGMPAHVSFLQGHGVTWDLLAESQPFLAGLCFPLCRLYSIHLEREVP